jgi:hypothetical protein
MAGRDLSRFVHPIKINTTDYKGSKALKSCYPEFLQIRVRPLYKEASSNKGVASFVVKKEDRLYLGKKERPFSCFYGERLTFAPDFLTLSLLIRYGLDAY